LFGKAFRKISGQMVAVESQREGVETTTGAPGAGSTTGITDDFSRFGK